MELKVPNARRSSSEHGLANPLYPAELDSFKLIVPSARNLSSSSSSNSSSQSSKSDLPQNPPAILVVGENQERSSTSSLEDELKEEDYKGSDDKSASKSSLQLPKFVTEGNLSDRNFNNGDAEDANLEGGTLIGIMQKMLAQGDQAEYERIADIIKSWHERNQQDN